MKSPIKSHIALSRLKEVTRAMCIGVDSPRSLAVHLLVKHDEWEQLASLAIDPSTYCDHNVFALDYGITNFLKKNGDLPSTVDKRGSAIAAFARSERSCSETNELLRAWRAGSICIDPAVAEVFHLAQRKVHRLLRNPPNLEKGPYEWGPGATYSLKRSEAYPDTKLTQLPFEVTGSAWKHAAKLIAADLHWKAAIVDANPNYQGPVFAVLPGGRYDTVPKTVLTDRSILVEPRLNTILQKKIGTQLRRLLKRVDVDLNDQSRNQYLAEYAIPFELSTIDLEAASDSVSRALVEWMLPVEWFDLLDDLRSKWYQDDKGSWFRLEKFSSMGNGFTFELESLIFWAFASAASELEGRSLIGVYGDDIIVRRKVAPRLIRALAVAGFSVNTKKSFIDGRFFESCGAHFFDGINVTPLYQKCTPRDELEASRMGNRLLRWSARLKYHLALDKRVRGAWETHRRAWNVPNDRFGPLTGDGDGYWESPRGDPSTVFHRTRAGVSGPETLVRTKVESYRLIPVCDSAMLARWFASSRVTDLRGDESWQTVVHRFRYWSKDPVAELTKNGFVDRSEELVGMQLSRVEMRVTSEHRWVKPTNLSSLAW